MRDSNDEGMTTTGRETTGMLTMGREMMMTTTTTTATTPPTAAMSNCLQGASREQWGQGHPLTTSLGP